MIPDKTGFLVTLILFFTPLLAFTQSQSKLVVEPSSLSLEVDEQTSLDATVYDANGKATQDTVIFYSRARASVSVTPEGQVKAFEPGRFKIVAVAVNQGAQLTEIVPVEVAHPPIETISLTNLPANIYAGTTLPLHFSVTDASGRERDEVDLALSSSDPSIAEVNQFEQLAAKNPGMVTLTAAAESMSRSWELEVLPNPVAKIQLTADASEVRTGDVVHLEAKPLTSEGETVADAPVTYSFTYTGGEGRGEGAAGKIEQDGRFVANKPGLYTLIAKSASAVDEHMIRVTPRNVQKDLRVVGHGQVLDKHTSDLWVWEGVDGRDYAVTGTWGAAGEAFFWDVTDPAKMQIVDTVTVDARTVNDVKISEDGRICVLTREGASDRKNGIVILDVTDPRNVKRISEYNEGLTGGVHNAFIWNDHVFAVNNGRRYDIINIEDPANPKTVSRFELDTPGHAVHDVWVENGIAYSSNWKDGVQIVDVGSTPQAHTPEKHDAGVGSPDNPVKLGSYTYPSGWNHAAFPFKSQSTGDFYVIAGDEAFPNGIAIRDQPTIPDGWIHFIKFEDGWDQPREVARYQVPEAGTHNFWVKGDTLYVAYYNAGLRVVDISGDLMGNLYEQGREIAKFLPMHHEAIVPNAAMSWGPQPYKGYIFVSDWNSGLWALKLEENTRRSSR
ncbi:LVIVD repeat-containing protein [Halalkalibaculum sp. DA3122]|uniref:LVIVD repeat-containing protein n=1 Tax=Halalkalibaculum sp. DA3122 TaxID=3373607 RepID=UPI003753EE64